MCMKNNALHPMISLRQIVFNGMRPAMHRSMASMCIFTAFGGHAVLSGAHEPNLSVGVAMLSLASAIFDNMIIRTRYANYTLAASISRPNHHPV